MSAEEIAAELLAKMERDNMLLWIAHREAVRRATRRAA